jgi:hypothetical protein
LLDFLQILLIYLIRIPTISQISFLWNICNQTWSLNSCMCVKDELTETRWIHLFDKMCRKTLEIFCFILRKLVSELLRYLAFFFRFILLPYSYSLHLFAPRFLFHWTHRIVQDNRYRSKANVILNFYWTAKLPVE